MSNWNPYAANLFTISMNALHFYSISLSEILPLPLSYQWHGWPGRITLSIDKTLNMHMNSSTGSKSLGKETSCTLKKFHVILMNQDHHCTSSLSVSHVKAPDSISYSLQLTSQSLPRPHHFSSGLWNSISPHFIVFGLESHPPTHLQPSKFLGDITRIRNPSYSSCSSPAKTPQQLLLPLG